MDYKSDKQLAVLFKVDVSLIKNMCIQNKFKSYYLKDNTYYIKLSEENQNIIKMIPSQITHKQQLDSILKNIKLSNNDLTPQEQSCLLSCYYKTL